MAINAPALVLTAAGLSVIAKGGILNSDQQKMEATGIPQGGPVFRFWFAIGAASLGIIAIDQWNDELAKGLALLWIVGGILANGKTIGTWLSGFGKGIAK